MNFMYLSVLLLAIVSQYSCERNTLTIGGVTVTWENLGIKTKFSASSPLGRGVSINDAWLGIGLNNFKRMSGINAVICRQSPQKTYVRNHLNGAFSTALMSASNPELGLTGIYISKLFVFIIS
jgi:hypothetical protein